MTSVIGNLQQVQQRIAAACAAAGRPVDEVTLLAVSKTFPAEAVSEAFAAGARSFGENYVQEALDKIATLADLRRQLQWHLIGPLQSNKTRPVAEAFDWVHSVDRLKIAQRLAEQRPPPLGPLQLCLQVNISGEASKSGVLPAEAAALALAVTALPAERVQLRGLMAIPEPAGDAAAQRAPHRALRELMAAVNAQLQQAGRASRLDTLSMGMSADLEAAIAEGATLVRVGTAIFGGRSAPPRGEPSPCKWGGAGA
ncbi:YggS family pyridoxal phosphate-dependent enzyme [Aquabacterium sp. OR-4]|uniref:YggS family pyridoxal phosphate-dependent enzyme n=1 Tax=Aquabacterium sp. OR-4 TaxID=2978127 RepID=UPI0021B3F5BE|nr:YggS family pyridoxal phosphate-dependent enzyme [Aquabacterium sp. OR-4]MDT7833823.1 YggS family pyridoxal phosphate-dependent enzyme [Aquabacterium sp. OR-4]